MAKWLEQASQLHEMCCHDLEAMSSNPNQVELGELSTSVLNRTWTKKYYDMHTKIDSPCLIPKGEITTSISSKDTPHICDG